MGEAVSGPVRPYPLDRLDRLALTGQFDIPNHEEPFCEQLVRDLRALRDRAAARHARSLDCLAGLPKCWCPDRILSYVAPFVSQRIPREAKDMSGYGDSRRLARFCNTMIWLCARDLVSCVREAINTLHLMAPLHGTGVSARGA